MLKCTRARAGLLALPNSHILEMRHSKTTNLFNGFNGFNNFNDFNDFNDFNEDYI